MKNNPYEIAKKQLKNSLELFDKNNTDLLEILSNPKRILEISIPVKMDSGEIKVFKGFRSQHNEARGPFKGGIRFHQDVSREEVKALSIWMTIKTSVLDLPLGGGKGGIIVNPKELSEKELEQLSRGYVREIYKYIGSGADVPAPDVNTNGQIMSWMMDEYSRLVGKYTPGSFTGKPLEVGGSLGRDKATAQGGIYSLLKILELNGDSLKDKKIVVQGAGNAGLTFAHLAEELGAKIIGISDSKGGIYNPTDGINLTKIDEFKANRQSVTECNSTTKIEVSNEDLLIQDCDILVPAALENQITENNADKVKAKYVVELANGPTTPAGDEILENMGITVIPDILANAGGVTVSYFEQVQNDMNFYWSAQEVEERLKEKMNLATTGVYNTAKEYETSLRKAAYIVSIKRVRDAMQLRGDLK
ncbi:MAG: Glu/Leu/Phe/Val dehydrogenase [Candidatus Gracilibacteria bacterium]|nr:Glu/Leu/Phe/Val dehydrogenase [Candidatus Gracilibacteria bacterium]